jgi:hypothetical protein
MVAVHEVMMIARADSVDRRARVFDRSPVAMVKEQLEVRQCVRTEGVREETARAIANHVRAVAAAKQSDLERMFAPARVPDRVKHDGRPPLPSAETRERFEEKRDNLAAERTQYGPRGFLGGASCRVELSYRGEDRFVRHPARILHAPVRRASARSLLGAGRPRIEQRRCSTAAAGPPPAPSGGGGRDADRAGQDRHATPVPDA